jgi:Asp-tRNA(Asn)/Glu-tRNA(Gln) amidotransferase A subunit family amidase
MKLMISQPMRGKTNEEIRKEREKIVKQLEQEGHEIVDTIIDDFIEGAGNNYAIRCLAKSIEFIADVDGVVFMAGWSNSRGCRIEYQVAVDYEKFILILEER